MEYDYADQLDLEWQGLLHGYLKAFSFQKLQKLYQYEEALQKIFCPENDIEAEVNYKDKELCERCLADCLNLLSNRPTPPRSTQIHFLLTIAKYTTRDETCYINLNANNMLPGLIGISNPLDTRSDKNTKILFLGLLNSFMEHPSGLKGLLETKYWSFAYKLVFYYQTIDEDISKSGYQFLTKLLGKALSVNDSFSYEIIQLIAGPLLNAAHTIEGQSSSQNVENLNMAYLKPSITCLTEILERLLQEYNAGALSCIINLKVDVASDTVSKVIRDKPISLILDRISIILSFFKLSDVFDGIKSISQDPLALTGFLRIVETEIDKGMMSLVFDLYYYGLKYLKDIYGKLPKCLLKGKNLDIEVELISLQVEPLIMVSEKFGNTTLIKDIDSDMVRKTHLSKIVNHVTFNAFKVALKIKDLIAQESLEVYTNALRNIVRSRNLYSKENLGNIFEALIFSLQDIADHVKDNKNHEYLNKMGIESFTLELVNAILLFIESFNLGWCDSVKILELAKIIHGGCTAYQWPTAVLVKTGKLLQEIIARRLSPSMSLLIDCAEDLKDFGPLLHQNSFTTEWEVRKCSMDLAHTIAESANKSFPSFKNLLMEVSFPQLASTIALNDENQVVRAAAFKCLQEIIVWDDIDKLLPRSFFINKSLDVLMSDVIADLKKEVVKLITIMYLHRDGLEDKVLTKVFKYLEHVALTSCDADVQLEALEFWTSVVKKHLSSQGWLDRKFPAVTFSKRIICMTNSEVRKRIYKVLNQLSSIGCLSVYVQVSRTSNLTKEAEEFINRLVVRFNTLFADYEVTPESMLCSQEFLDMSPVASGVNLPLVPTSSPEQLLQEIIDDTVMKMIPDDLEFVQHEDLYSTIDNKFGHKPPPVATFENHVVTPSEFVHFVYKRMEYLVNTKELLDDYLSSPDTKSSDDQYNIIDY